MIYQYRLAQEKMKTSLREADKHRLIDIAIRSQKVKNRKRLKKWLTVSD